jgi:hypothetical protein
VQSFKGFIRIIPCVDIAKHSPKSIQAVLLKTDLVCYTFLESALEYIVEVQATGPQNYSMYYKRDLRLSEIYGYIGVFAIIE